MSPRPCMSPRSRCRLESCCRQSHGRKEPRGRGAHQRAPGRPQKVRHRSPRALRRPTHAGLPEQGEGGAQRTDGRGLQRASEEGVGPTSVGNRTQPCSPRSPQNRQHAALPRPSAHSIRPRLDRRSAYSATTSRPHAESTIRTGCITEGESCSTVETEGARTQSPGD
ncbi:uncharacterized protein SCHCODRAFT_01218986 [Schizophyllum commune H4-8]|uniref:uncharacterized protein n=1 Tax=Schizophyllum commune (strain H4-8 / FGSC 9210) TaxID=578458 RepID=UPI00215E24BF|nr:uncharacterized protein SCHCODRAFT_01218986 [Schizophyllum commune H4-8]KAI5893104.1 hypothetical protein SCHCODRAFT_01218986 [Schizophyllum commune H4-8]